MHGTTVIFLLVYACKTPIKKHSHKLHGHMDTELLGFWGFGCASHAWGVQPGILDPEIEDFEAKFYSAVTDWRGEEYPLATTNIIPATLGVEKTKKGRCAQCAGVSSVVLRRLFRQKSESPRLEYQNCIRIGMHIVYMHIRTYVPRF